MEKGKRYFLGSKGIYYIGIIFPKSLLRTSKTIVLGSLY